MTMTTTPMLTTAKKSHARRRRSTVLRAQPAGLPSHGSTPVTSRAPGDYTKSPSRSATTWPELEALGLSPAAHEQRANLIGGSDANLIMSGSPERVLRLWREKRGQEAPEDLTGNLAVMLGSWSEAFNRQWYERATGKKVSRAGESMTCPRHTWRGCTLDGYLVDEDAVWEAKHLNAFTKPDEALARYMPQLQHAMAVMRVSRAVLSVIFGNARWEVFEVAADWLYQEDLFAAEQAFWSAVESGEAPVALPPPPVPKPIGVREVCLEASSAWAAAAADWTEHRDAARKHQAAVIALKELVEPDVARAFGHGIEIKRSKAGALAIKAMSS